MIIIGQNKDVIINFNQIRGIYIEDVDPEDKAVNKYKISADGGNAIFPLGRYFTEERAKEVIQSMAKEICTQMENSSYHNNYYNMPKG